MSGPLQGVRILDLTTVVLGPFATQLLGDLGAEIIKVEPPEGDITRHLAPMRSPAMGAIFLHMNRNKRSIVLDLKQPTARDALLRLAAAADVFVYNTRPQAMARLRLAYADVRAVNPGIVYAGAFGFDQSGPYAPRPAYDDLIQGAVGFPYLLMRAGFDSPRYVPATVCDRAVGQAAANAILAALFHRARTGEGQSVEVPMFETMAQFVLGDHFGGRSFEPPLGEAGYARVLAKFRAPYATLDGHICALIYNDKQWKSFLALIGKPEMFTADERFNSHANRANRIEEVYSFVADELRTRTTEECKAIFTAGDIPWMSMNSLDDLIADPHLNATGFYMAVEHPSEGSMLTTRVPSRWSATPPQLRSHAPRLGEHSVEILREAGYAQADIEDMAASGATLLG
jgi:crotonobetainyl-CoA:carnitine CoA-transferase CaiB-like acyl-CoA transferase